MLSLVAWARWSARGGVPAKRGFFVAGLVAWTAGVPIVASSFGRFALCGLFANYAMVAAADAAVAASIAGILASFFSDVLAAYANNFAALLLHVMAGVSETIAKMPGASMEVERWTAGECAAWYALSAAVFWFAALRQNRSFLI